ncbi:hypothetical protein K788_0008330 [Paraburkholderia caribensis MBA4]|uniref:Uncharacterized protein n=1 Tax=Paraburkholderia caribensis MBA4 TaxID=1323664 RepID=A0A0P0RF10_9BURK|nr:hypothetical protein K788_0008330 [Paraburkholderia caribensis MBA4]
MIRLFHVVLSERQKPVGNPLVVVSGPRFGRAVRLTSRPGAAEIADC